MLLNLHNFQLETQSQKTEVGVQLVKIKISLGLHRQDFTASIVRRLSSSIIWLIRAGK